MLNTARENTGKILVILMMLYGIAVTSSISGLLPEEPRDIPPDTWVASPYNGCGSYLGNLTCAEWLDSSRTFREFCCIPASAVGTNDYSACVVSIQKEIIRDDIP